MTFGPGHNSERRSAAPRQATAGQESARAPPRSTALLVAHHHGDHLPFHVLVEPSPRSTAAQATEGEPASVWPWGRTALGSGPFGPRRRGRRRQSWGQTGPPAPAVEGEN